MLYEITNNEVKLLHSKPFNEETRYIIKIKDVVDVNKNTLKKPMKKSLLAYLSQAQRKPL